MTAPRQPKVYEVWVDTRNTRGEVVQIVESITASKSGALARAQRINTHIEQYPNQVAWVEYNEAAEEAYHPNSNRKLTDAEIEEILDLRAQGEKLRVIADLFGIGTSTVSKICNGTRRERVKKPSPNRKLTDAQIDEIGDLQAQGMSMASIAKRFDVAPSTLYRHLSGTYGYAA